MTIVIEDVPMKKLGSPIRSEFIQKLHEMKPGQSFYSDKPSTSSRTMVLQAKAAKRHPLVGDFRVAREGTGSRVGRVS